MVHMAYSKHEENYVIKGMEKSRGFPARQASARRVGTKFKIAFYFLATVFVMFFAGFVLFCRLVAYVPGDTGRADGIVALTGGEARIPAAIKLLAAGNGRRLLISGVNPSTTRQELVSLMPDSKVWFRCCIDVDKVARDTIGNANETQNWMEQRQFRSVIVVTASYHMPRSLAELRRALPDAELIPHPVRPRNLNVEDWWTDPRAFSLLLSEYVKFVPTLGRCVLMQMHHGQGVVGGTRQCINGGYSG
jgi:uncharacterized SAM-binding protein YcdF (DUF218 family)